MSRKKKILILSYIVVIILIIIFGTISFFWLFNKEFDSIDMNMLNENLLNEANFRNERTLDITLDNIEEIFNINSSSVEDVIGKVPFFNISSGMYVVFKVNELSVDEVLEKITEYGNLYEKEWSTYMEDQYELVKTRKIGKIGNYVYMIVSENAEDMLKCITK